MGDWPIEVCERLYGECGGSADRLSILEQLREHSLRIGSVDAICADDGIISYRELYERVSAEVDLLQSRGIGDRSVVGLAVPNEVDHLIATLALLGARAHQVTLASHDTGAFKDALERRLHLTHVVESLPSGGMAGLRQTPGRSPQGASATGYEGAVYFNTSGTTGEMKIVPLTDRQIAAQARHHPNYAGERLLRQGSIEHNIAKRLRLYCVCSGGTNVLAPRGEFDVVELCARQGVTELDISRLHAADLATRDTDALRGVKISVAGSPLPFDVRRSIERNITRKLTVRYGATECGTIAFAGPGEHDENEVVGIPVSGLELQIVDSSDTALGVGASGQIRVRVDGMATEYVDNAAETEARFHDGWFYPGDIGLIRADGRLVVQGRGDDMMILNGINVFPAEIERVLERHPAVRASAALPLQSTVHGQIPVAAVELRPDAVVTPAELLSYARELLALRAPRRILVLEALPRNGQGKILRRELAAHFDIGRPKS